MRKCANPVNNKDIKRANVTTQMLENTLRRLKGECDKTVGDDMKQAPLIEALPTSLMTIQARMEKEEGYQRKSERESMDTARK